MELNFNIMCPLDYLTYLEDQKAVKQQVRNRIKELHLALNRNLNHKNHNHNNKLYNLADSLSNEYIQIFLILYINHQIPHQMPLIFHQLIFCILQSICVFEPHFFDFFHTIFLYKML